MLYNSKSHYSPDDTTNCVPTSNMACIYCRNKTTCTNKLPSQPYSALAKANSDTDKPVKAMASNLFDD